MKFCTKSMARPYDFCFMHVSVNDWFLKFRPYAFIKNIVFFVLWHFKKKNCFCFLYAHRQETYDSLEHILRLYLILISMHHGLPSVSVSVFITSCLVFEGSAVTVRCLCLLTSLDHLLLIAHCTCWLWLNYVWFR